MHRFHVPDFSMNATAELSHDEGHHLSRVLRLKPGDAVAIFDGRGREALARVERVDSRRVIVRVTDPREPAREAAIALTLAQGLLKSDKMDRVIRDAVMLGVARIQPFVSMRTDVPRAALRTGVRQERWDRTVLASVKQCGRAVVPPVLETRDLTEVLRATAGVERVMCVEPSSAGPEVVMELKSLEARQPSEAMILIGPEGGWDAQEIAGAMAAGVTLVTLGSRTLRADAAGAVAIAVVRYIWKDL